MVQPPEHLSPTSWNLWDQCPLAWCFRYVDGVTDPPSVAKEVGTFAHRVLELLFGVPAPERTVGAARAIATAEWTTPGTVAAGQATEGEFKARAWAAIVGLWDLEDPRRVAVEATERRVEWTVQGVPMVAIVDRVERNTAGLLTVADYKGFPPDTPIPTPTGWTTMGSLVVGSRVLDSLGKPTRVTGVSSVREVPCYEVAFSDGSSLVADEDHRWVVDYRDWNRKRTITRTLTTAEMEGVRYLRVANTAPLELPEADLPIPPYLLGVWLGDGTVRDARVCLSADKVPLLERFEDAGFSIKEYKGAYIYGVGGGFKRLLRETGLLHNKHIPSAYLRASYSQRLDLLRGLMDTDGSWAVQRKRCVFTNTSIPLMEGMDELILSLGWHTSSFNGIGSYGGKECRPYRILSFLPDVNPFWNKVKADRYVPPSPQARGGFRTVRSVRRVESVPTKCITVDSLTSMYLVGRRMIPTHNSGSYKPKYQAQPRRQIAVGALAVAHEYGPAEVGAAGRVLYTAAERTVKAPTDPETLVSTATQAEATWLAVTEACATEEFPPTAGPLCVFCPHVAVCPEGQSQVRRSYGWAPADAPGVLALAALESEAA